MEYIWFHYHYHYHRLINHAVTVRLRTSGLLPAVSIKDDVGVPRHSVVSLPFFFYVSLQFDFRLDWRVKLSSWKSWMWGVWLEDNSSSWFELSVSSCECSLVWFLIADTWKWWNLPWWNCFNNQIIEESSCGMWVSE